MLKVGITGGIGSGKTTCCRIFEELGVPIYYADLEAKKIMNSNKALKEKLKTAFGKEAYYRNGRLNRPFIASQVFNDKEKLELLNSIVHPILFQEAYDWFNTHDGVPYAIQEAAIMIESGSYRLMDKVILVTAPIETRIDRVMKRDRSTREQVQSRINSQMSDEEKKAHADFIIINESWNSLKPQIEKIHTLLSQS